MRKEERFLLYLKRRGFLVNYKMDNKEFFSKIVSNFKDHFDKVRGKAFTNQSVDSCLDIYNLCFQENPEKVVEMGTNYGCSTIALAKAMSASLRT